MSEPDIDPVGPDDSEIPPASPTPNQLCIISSDPLRAFIGAFNPALRAKEEFTIIVDRRRADLGNAVRPAIERRHRPSVDAKVKTDGFAIVPLSMTDALHWIERAVDHQFADNDADADERELRHIEFKRRHNARVSRLVRVSAIVCAFSVLVVLFLQIPAGKALVNRVRLVASPTTEPTPQPPIQAQAPSGVEAPASLRLSRPRAERVSRPREATRTPTESSTSLQSEGQPVSPGFALPVRPQSISEPADVAPTPRPDVTSPPRPLIVVSPEPTSSPATVPGPVRPAESNFPPPIRPSNLWASALDPTTSSEGNPPPRAQTASTPGETPAGLSSVQRQPSARDLKALESRVASDVNTAGVDAKWQFDELKSKTMKSLDQMRRMWSNATHVFSDRDANKAQGEAAAGLRR